MWLKSQSYIDIVCYQESQWRLEKWLVNGPRSAILRCLTWKMILGYFNWPMPRAIYDVRTRENVSVACEWDIKWLLYIHTIHANASTIRLNTSSADNDSCHTRPKVIFTSKGNGTDRNCCFCDGEVVSQNLYAVHTRTRDIRSKLKYITTQCKKVIPNGGAHPFHLPHSWKLLPL